MTHTLKMIGLVLTLVVFPTGHTLAQGGEHAFLANTGFGDND